MTVDVHAPPLSQTADTLVIVEWLKQVGDPVTKGEILFKVETDKAVLEVESPASGTLSAILASAGEEVKVRSVIGSIAEADALGWGGEALPLERQNRLFASPRARQLAAIKGVPLEALQGSRTGPGGLIVERDVNTYLEQREATPRITPLARRMAETTGVDLSKITPSRPGGTITKADIHLRVADKIRSHAGITVRSLDMADFPAELSCIKSIYNTAWEKNWGFVPMTDAEFHKLARDLKPIVRPELCFIAEDQGEPVAFTLTVPDVNQALRHAGGRLTTFGLPLGHAKLLWYQRRITKVRLLALGIKEGWRRRGLDAVLIVETIRRTGELGYEGGEVGWTLEDNDLINKAIEGVGGQRSRVYRVFRVGGGG